MQTNLDLLLMSQQDLAQEYLDLNALITLTIQVMDTITYEENEDLFVELAFTLKDAEERLENTNMVAHGLV